MGQQPTALYGRVPESERLHGLITGVDQQGAALVLSGPAGIGKSALLRAARDHAEEHGFWVLATTGVRSETQMPFVGLQQLLRPLSDSIAHLPETQRAVLAAVQGQAQALPELFLVGLALLGALSEAAAHRPLLVVVDDAHWLDRPSRQVLVFLARRIAFDPVVMLIGARDEPSTTDELQDLPVLRVGPLAADAAHRLLDECASDLAAGVRRELLELAEGNPLALCELSTAWRGQRGSLSTDEVTLGTRLEDAFANRARELSDRGRAALLVLALGDTQSLGETLAAAGSWIGEEVDLTDLEQAEVAGLISIERDRLRFRHPLVGAAIRSSASRVERDGAHRSLARTLAHEPDRAVWHRAACATDADEDLAEELERTAERASRRRGTLIAIQGLVRAAELTPAASARARRTLRAAELAFEIGRADLCADLIEQTTGLGSDRHRSRLIYLRELLDDASGATSVTRLVAIAERLRDADEHGFAADLLARSAMRCIWHNRPPAERECVIDALDRLPLTDDDPRRILIMAFASPMTRGARVIETLAAVDPDGDLDPETLRIYGLSLTAISEFDLASRFLDRAITGLRQQGRLALLTRALVSRGFAAVAHGEFDVTRYVGAEAARLAEETGQPRWAQAAKLAMARAAGLGGDAEAADALLADAEAGVVPGVPAVTRAELRMARGAVALGAGRYDEAFEALHPLFERTGDAYLALYSARSYFDYIDAGGYSGRLEEARSSVATIRALDRVVGSSLLRASAAFGEAATAEEGAADALYRRALSVETGMPRCLGARTRLAYGIWLRRQRRIGEARTVLHAALDGFASFGARPGVARAAQEIRATGSELAEDLSGEQRTALEGLTAQERQVVEMAAEGMANREIAQRLFLSPRTVGAHLYRAFPKLGITSRAELPRALGRVDTDAERPCQQT